MFDDRHVYRRTHAKKGLVSFEITVKETNLHIQADRDLSAQAVRSVLRHRNCIEHQIAAQPEFAASLSPLPEQATAPAIVSEMLLAGLAAQVGPMAAVAGAVAESTGRDLLAFSDQVVVENGGDVFIASREEMVFSIFAGNSPLSMKAGIRVKAQPVPYGMCTSSGSFGHSRSFGRADAVSVMADSCALADAAATALCNRVRSPGDIKTVLERGQAIPGVKGIVIIVGKALGVWGEDLTLVRL